MPWKSVHWEPSFSMWTDGQADMTKLIVFFAILQMCLKHRASLPVLTTTLQFIHASCRSHNWSSSKTCRTFLFYVMIPGAIFHNSQQVSTDSQSTSSTDTWTWLLKIYTAGLIITYLTELRFLSFFPDFSGLPVFVTIAYLKLIASWDRIVYHVRLSIHILTFSIKF
jgi:hypothetical protein